MDSFELPILITAFIVNSFLGLFTYLKNPKSATNKLFFIFTITISVYLFINYTTLHPFFQPTVFWIRTTMTLALLINICFFLFANAFPGNKQQISPIIFWGTIIFTVLLIPATQTTLIFKEVLVKSTGVETVPGIGMPLFLLHTVFLLGGGFVVLIRKFRKSYGKEKAQIRLLLLGTVFMFSFILTTNLFLVLVFKNSSLVGLLPIYTLLFIGFVSYAIVRHRFLDIGLIVAISVAYTLVSIIAGTLYVVAIFLISSYFFEEKIALQQTLTFALLALFSAFTFQPLKNFLEKFTDKVFFKGHYSTNKLIFTLTKIMATTLHLNELTKNILHELLDTMRISKGAFVFFAQNNFYITANEGYEKNDYTIEKLEKLCDFKRLILFDEEPEGQTKELMRELSVAVVLPLYNGINKLGLLLLGNKKSGEIYSQQDIEVLNILGPEMLVAIQNAKSYEEISKFNITLQQKIDQATEELRITNQKLIKLDQLKDEFVSVASHELRTPMTAIKSYLWMTLDGRAGAVSEKQKFYLNRAYSSVDRLIRLVNDMLNVSRIDSGRVTLEFSSVDLQTMTQEVFDEVVPRAQELGLTLKIIPNQNLAKVLADIDKIKEVLFNLIGNALKFTPKGGVVTVSFMQKDDFVETTVTDTGTGILPEDISKLFQKFSMVDSSFTSDRGIQGTGLGLYICKSIVELHKGKIWVTSEGRDKGSQFIFSLPVFHEGDLQNISQPIGTEKKTVGIVHTEI